MPDISEIISFSCLLSALVILIVLCIIDLKVRLLPDPLVLTLALLGLAFHISNQHLYANLSDIFFGALIGGGLLYTIRTIGNFLYKQDTLGLGDVKLMAAGGLWLGQNFILTALIAGALASILHGGIVYTINHFTNKNTESLTTFSIPAGPGFAVGLIIAALAKLSNPPYLLF